ncbi:Type II secretion system protein C [Sulfitobacter noctilucae]|uniref:type II secretion system protein N n=1 Tax=Sulfitobacter noctilucae TaxID=1342302 RepID=UPI0004698ED2|nr:type II secretion system protein N [Sulfitobacter noctilucae]KIN74984.1 Type II secretion system protein C [Sulfitobacter noctilucae]
MTAARLWMLTAVVILALLASLIFAAAQLIWHTQGHTSVLPHSLPPLAIERPDIAPRVTGAIIALAPFGRAAAPEAARDTQARSQISATLRGVLVDPDPSASRAFVLVGGQTAVYRLGDPVDAAELVAINTDTVTLRSADGLVIVGFDGVENADTTAVAQTNSTVAENPDDAFARLAAAIVPGQGSIDLRDAPPPETTEEYISFWRDRITQNPQAAMDRVGVELVENGYRVKQDPNIGVTLAGLRAGDVVTRLNGQTLGDLDGDRLLYDEVAASGIARLEVVREGKALLLTFPLR